MKFSLLLPLLLLISLKSIEANQLTLPQLNISELMKTWLQPTSHAKDDTYHAVICYGQQAPPEAPLVTRQVFILINSASSCGGVLIHRGWVQLTVFQTLL